MQTVKFKSLRCDVAVQVPSTVEEYDKLAKKEGACLSEAIANVIYRSTLAQFRDKFTSLVEERTGIERGSKETDKKDADGNVITVYTETEGEYMNRVYAEKGWVEELSTGVNPLQAVADEVSASLVFDPSATERKPAQPKKAPKKYLNAVEEKYVAGKQDALAGKLGVKLTGEKEKDVQVLALALRALVEKQLDEAITSQANV